MDTHEEAKKAAEGADILRSLDEVFALHAKWLNGEEGGERANLSGRSLHAMSLVGLDLSGAVCVGTSFYGINGAGMKLRGANCYAANFFAANLVESDCSGTSFFAANLGAANFSRSKLPLANLYGANAYATNFSNADLTKAILSDSNLCGANFKGATTQGRAIRGAYTAARGFAKFGHESLVVLATTADRADWFWFSGCVVGGEEVVRNEIDRRYGESDAALTSLRAMDFLLEMAKDPKSKPTLQLPDAEGVQCSSAPVTEIQ